MRLVLDVESDNLEPGDCKNVWCIVAKDVDTGYQRILRWPIARGQPLTESFLKWLRAAGSFIGHNIIGYDREVLSEVLNFNIPLDRCIDTLCVSRLVDFERYDPVTGKHSHSLESWGNEFGIVKQHADVDASFFQQWSQELEDRCISDCEINVKLFKKLEKYIYSKKWACALRAEHDLTYVTYVLHKNGFGFHLENARVLKVDLEKSILELDKDILGSFAPKVKRIKEVNPRITKYGTLNKNDFRFVSDGDLSPYSDAPFTRIEFIPFNPGSPAQIVERLNEAGWRPTERTKGYLLAVRNKEKDKVEKYRKEGTGWKISQENLSTLPETAPIGARKLAERLLLASRVSDLEEWIKLTREAKNEKGHFRVHGSFAGIGAWTGRMSHRKPNTANIPTEKPQDTPAVKELNHAVRRLWIAGPERLLVGVDADQIQLRILAHYMQDERFTKALVEGDKEKGTDVHSLNVRAIGPACKGRRDAKTFIYSWLLGAGVARVAEILGCPTGEARDAREGFVEYYPGLKRVREVDIRRDARRGYFEGLDGRYVKIFAKQGEDPVQSRQHYCLGGYLQNGEKVVMTHAAVNREFGWFWRFKKEKLPVNIVNFVHDEYQLEVPEDDALALYVAGVVADSIALAGDFLQLRCPMKGSIRNDHGLTIGKNWLETH